MEKATERIVLKIMLGVVLVLLLGLSTLLVTAISGQNPLDTLFPVSKEQAVNIAQNRIQGEVQEVEPATSDNPVYEVEIQDKGAETDVTVDAKTGNIVNIEEDMPESQARRYTRNSPISEQDAKDIAARETRGRVTDFEVERRNGRVVYEVEIRKDGREADVHVDAETGRVVEIEWEDEDDDDD